MNKKTVFSVIALTASVWIGSLAWLSGYQQGYSEGAETAWDDARSALSDSPPVLQIDSVKLSQLNNEGLPPDAH